MGYQISQISPDKVNGKPVKYKQGDCLGIACKKGKFLGALISKKFNKYYDVTLIQFYEDRPPVIDDFVNGKFFGTRSGSWEELTYAVNVRMMKCKYFDGNVDIQKIGTVQLISNINKDGYKYVESIEDLLDAYMEELPIRIEKSKNAEKFPALAFMSKHLVEMKHIIQQ